MDSATIATTHHEHASAQCRDTNMLRMEPRGSSRSRIYHAVPGGSRFCSHPRKSTRSHAPPPPKLQPRGHMTHDSSWNMNPLQLCSQLAQTLVLQRRVTSSREPSQTSKWAPSASPLLASMGVALYFFASFIFCSVSVDLCNGFHRNSSLVLPLLVGTGFSACRLTSNTESCDEDVEEAGVGVVEELVDKPGITYEWHRA